MDFPSKLSFNASWKLLVLEYSQLHDFKSGDLESRDLSSIRQIPLSAANENFSVWVWSYLI